MNINRVIGKTIASIQTGGHINENGTDIEDHVRIRFTDGTGIFVEAVNLLDGDAGVNIELHKK